MTPSQNPILLPLDADVLIAAHHDYFPRDLFPGFWDCLASHIDSGQLMLIDQIRNEIAGPLPLAEWVGLRPDHSESSTGTQPIADTYGKIADWVQNSAHYTEVAKKTFMEGADGWLAAYCLQTGNTLITNEVFNPNINRKVPLPIICKEFRIKHSNTIGMLRILDARFCWLKPKSPS